MTDRIAHHPDLPLFSSPNKTIPFTFKGKTIEAHEGDTVASALFAAGVRITSRSFKYHHPRGLKDNFEQGPEGLMTADHTANVRADMTYVKEGMRVEIQKLLHGPRTRLSQWWMGERRCLQANGLTLYANSTFPFMKC